MAQDLVVKLLLKSGAFSNDIKIAKGQIQNFQKGCKNAGNGIKAFTDSLGLNITSLTKFSGVMAVAAAAGKTIKDGLKQNADFMDEFTRKTETAKGAWANFTNAVVNGGAFSSFKDLRKEIREAWNAWDAWDTANRAIGTVLGIQETQYRRLIEVARDVSLADVDRLDALNQAATIMQKQINMQRALANLEKNRSKEAMDAALAEKGIKSYSTKTLHKLLEIDENGRWGFENYYDANKPTSKELEKAWMKGGGIYALAKALLNIEADSEKGFKILQDYVKNNIFNAANDLVDYNEQQMKTEIERIRKRILGKEDNKPTTTNTPKILDEELKANEDLIKQLKEKLEKEKAILATLEEGTKGWFDQYDLIKDINNQLQETLDKMDAIKRRQHEAELGPLPAIDSSKLQGRATTSIGGALPNKGDDTTSISFREGLAKAQEFANALQGTAFSVSMLSDSLKKLREDEEEGVTGWEKFVDVLSMVVNSLNTIASMLETVNTITELSGNVAKKAAGEKAAAAAEEASASTSAAIAGVAKANSWLGVAGVAVGVAGLIALLVSSQKKAKNVYNYANGGIVGGTSFTGDRVSANVNSGEMILNRGQQARLWNQINNGGSNQVTFHISGTELVGCLNNNRNKSRLTR